jgi:hypothetical protein
MESPTSKSELTLFLRKRKYSSLRAFIRVTSVRMGSSSLSRRNEEDTEFPQMEELQTNRL